jgi:hypothetical protein
MIAGHRSPVLEKTKDKFSRCRGRYQAESVGQAPPAGIFLDKRRGFAIGIFPPANSKPVEKSGISRMGGDEG